jgi:RHS repeat-associated protein
LEYNLPGGKVIGRLPESSGRHYYLKDHLGSIRAVLDGGGGVRETRDYYPFGLPMPGRYEKGSPPIREDFTGHVKDEATQLHYAGARYYSAAFGRFTTTDRFADKYPSRSPYQYAANNPVLNVDVNGDSIDVSQLRAQNPELLNKMVTQLSAIAGTNYTVTDEGMLVQMEMPKSEIMGVEVQLQGLEGGSETAQKMLSKAISDKQTINVGQWTKSLMSKKGTGVPPGTNNVIFNPKQMSQLEKNATGISKIAQGTGMTFLHEIHHTNIFGSLTDGPNKRKLGNLGQVVPKVNNVRRELGMSVRTSYAAKKIGGSAYFPYSTGSLGEIRRNIVPSNKYTKQKVIK